MKIGPILDQFEMSGEIAKNGEKWQKKMAKNWQKKARN